MQQSAFHAVPRLLHTVELAQPRASLQHDVFAWAATAGAAIYTQEQFNRFVDQAKAASTADSRLDPLVHDLYLAQGALTASQRRPARGWEGYLAEWESRRIGCRIKASSKTDFSRLRELEIAVGGILLRNRGCPLCLVIPQEAGTWIQMGWEAVTEVGGNPFAADAAQLPILRYHEVPMESALAS